MKHKFIKYIALGLGSLMMTGGCTDDFQEINTNPSSISPLSFNPNYLLTTSQLTYTGSTDFAYETWRGNLIYAATMTQGLSSVMGYWAGDKYLLNEGYTAAYWERSYSEQVKAVADLVEFTRDKEQYNNLHQIGRIMKALIMERITDLYGDIPYFEAGMGYYTGVITPKYDSQEAIYKDLLKEVDEAATALDEAGDTPIGDTFYGGNIGKWKRFANTLMLRMAMRISEVDAATAQTYVTKATGKTMTSNEDNAFVAHDLSGGRVTQNRNSQVLLGDGGPEQYYVKWSDTFIDFLKSHDDPRISAIAVTGIFTAEGDKDPSGTDLSSAPEDQKGMPNGKDLSTIAPINQDPSFTAMEDYSSPNPGMLKRDGRTFILTYAQSELLLADAASRGWASDAESHYNNGITAAMTYLSQYDAELGVDEAEAQAYLVQNPFPASQDAQMEAIHTQYWALCNTMFDFYESWSNWRRTGYPELTPVNYPNNATGGTIPLRFPYPVNEATSNPVNYEAAREAISGGDNLTSRVWWDTM